jgi:Tol biopolymer transport system component
VAGVAALVATVVITSLVTSRLLTRAPTGAVPTWRLAWSVPDDLTLGGGPDHPFGLALGPDGRRLVFPATREGLGQLWIRDLSSGDTQPLAGTDGATLPFWAPDGRAIGFFARARLLALTLDNGGIADLGAAPLPRGGAWQSNGDVIFAPDDGGLMRRRGSDGAVEPLTHLDVAAGESSHRHPTLVDTGRRVLFYVVAAESSRQGIWIAPLDRPDARVRLASSDGHAVASGETVVYASGDGLVAQALDPEPQKLAGRQTFLAAPVGVSPQHQLLATVQGDLLMYGRPAAGRRVLRWVDRGGTVVGTVGDPMHAWDVRLAPAGTRVAVSSVDPQLNTLDIFVYDGDRPVPRRLSLAIDADETPVWSRDGSQIAWTSARRSVTRRRALADRSEELVRKSEHPVRITDWTPDGRWLIVSESRPGTRADLWQIPADVGEARAYAQSPFNEVQGVVSPDGRWMAYASDESGRYEIYVDAFPAPGTRGRLSSGGGLEPRWNADGTELYFRRGTEIHAVRPALTSTPEATASERLFDARVDIRSYDVTPDGRRFLLNLPAEETERAVVTVVVNWRQLLPRQESNTRATP